MDNGKAFWGGVSPKVVPSRRTSMSTTGKDICAAARNGTIPDVEVALAQLKKVNGNIDSRNAFGSSSLHIAVWRNHLPIVRRLLAAGADPNARDGESGWSSLHRALHFGHLAVAGVLVEAGGSLGLEDTKGRTPIDLMSAPVKQSLAGSSNLGGKEVFSWGNGSNYQLGIGSTGILRVPARIDALQGLDVVAVAAAKFHSVALTASGEVFSWGFGRGGRLGHPDFDIHSGQAAVITPRQISHSFGCRGVSVIAVAKHHTVVATKGGEVYTWGSNREGRLGYPSVDTQPTPRRVSTLKAKIVGVSAANKHSAVLTEAGEVYTWGCNTEGQLGYGTSNSVSNYVPRVVECLKGKKLVSVSAAKYHTVVLGAEGEVLTWGYKMVTPRRISVVRNTKKAGSLPLKFHISERLHVVAISAGMTHTSVLSEDGLVFYWYSEDPLLKCHQVLSLAGHEAVAISSSKFRTAVATAAGDVYSWDGKNSKAETTPVPIRVHGVKHATQLSVGENHSVVVAAVYIPDYTSNTHLGAVNLSKATEGDADPEGDSDGFSPRASPPNSPRQDGMNNMLRPLPSLKELSQRAAARSVLEPKNALQILEFAESLEADILKGHCEEMIVRNLDYILTIAPALFGHVRPSLLAQVEKVLDGCSTQSWSHRRLPTPSATLPAVVDSEEEDLGGEENAFVRGVVRESRNTLNACDEGDLSEGFLNQSTETSIAILKQARAARKKLQQIEALELKQESGLVLDDQQRAKIQTKGELERVLISLEAGVLPQARFIAHDTVTQGRDSLEKPLSSEEHVKNRSGRSKRHRQSDKMRSSGRNSTESPPVGRIDFCEQKSSSTDFSAFHIIPREISETVGGEAENSPSKNSGFETIAGFAKGSRRGTPENRDAKIKSVMQHAGSQFEQSKPGMKETMPSLESPREQPLLPRKRTPLGKKGVKGGLSTFLSGALDEPQRVVASLPPPVTPKVEGPAWGGGHAPKRSTSLRAIQSEQKMEPSLVYSKALIVGSGSSSMEEKSKQVATPKYTERSPTAPEDMSQGKVRVPLSQFVRSSPIAVANVPSSSKADSENSPPPWAGATSVIAGQSLRDIQLQQGKPKVLRRPYSHGSPTQVSPVGASFLSSTSEHKPLEGSNRWFKPEVGSPSALRCIQIEERAMQDLAKLYKNVKLVRDDGK